MWIGFLVVVTSAFGTVLRFCQNRFFTGFKKSRSASIFAASLISCFICGIFNALLFLIEVSPILKEIICSGFLCGYSSFAVLATAAALITKRKKGWGKSILYSLSSFILSLCFYFIGFFGTLLLH
ncbi:MAG: CrcB family protein [Bifidobacteriaceae bacterium]|nr:CrcB family protein [Aeriscardovia sp.]MBQ1803785.1 CrcB family protein [Bifidobacteriaceae bacterium]